MKDGGGSSEQSVHATTTPHIYIILKLIYTQKISTQSNVVAAYDTAEITRH